MGFRLITTHPSQEVIEDYWFSCSVDLYASLVSYLQMLASVIAVLLKTVKF